MGAAAEREDLVESSDAIEVAGYRAEPWSAPVTSPAVWETDALPASFAFPERAFQVTVRFFTASGHKYRDIVLFTDDYQQRKADGSIAGYLDEHVIPRLKKDWYPFPADSGDRWVLPVILNDGVYAEDHEAPNPLDSFSVSFASGGTGIPQSHGQRPIPAGTEVADPPLDETGDGCRCAGRGERRHDLLCESILRHAFGSIGNAPGDVKQLLRGRNRPVAEGGVRASPVEASFLEAGPAAAPAVPGRPRRPLGNPDTRAPRRRGSPGPA